MALNNMETFLWQGQKLKIVLTTYLAVNLIVYKDFTVFITQLSFCYINGTTFLKTYMLNGWSKIFNIYIYIYIYMFIKNNYPFTSGAHTGGVPAVRLKYNYVHIIISS